MDYCKLNSITRKDAYPLPCIDDTLDILHDSRWFNMLDLASGYWQVELNEEDQQHTAFLHSKWPVQVQGHTIWPVQCTGNISKIDGLGVDWFTMVLSSGLSR